MSKMSMKKGLWFHLPFKDDSGPHQVALHINPMTGKEVVYVDDHPASVRRNLFASRSRHAININEQDLIVELEETSGFNNKYRVSLKKNLTTLSVEEKTLYGDKGALKSIGPQLLAGIVFGMSIAFISFWIIQAIYGGAQ